MYIKVTNIDSITLMLCTEAVMLNGPSLPSIKDFIFEFAAESKYPLAVDNTGIYLEAPLYYGTCAEDADISLVGVVAAITEEQYNSEKEMEHQARRPYPSWVGDLATMSWQPPVPYPQDGNFYQWDEPTVSWVQIN